MTNNAQEAYIRGFCKVANYYGVDPRALIKVAGGKITKLRGLRNMLSQIESMPGYKAGLLPEQLVTAIKSDASPSEINKMLGDYQLPTVSQARAQLHGLHNRLRLTAEQAPAATAAPSDVPPIKKKTDPTQQPGGKAKQTLKKLKIKGQSAQPAASAAEQGAAAAAEKSVPDYWTRRFRRMLTKDVLRASPLKLTGLMARDPRLLLSGLGFGLAGGLASRLGGGDRSRNAIIGGAAGAGAGAAYGGLLAKRVGDLASTGGFTKLPLKAKGKLGLMVAAPALLAGGIGALSGGLFGEKKKNMSYWQRLMSRFS